MFSLRVAHEEAFFLCDFHVFLFVSQQCVVQFLQSKHVVTRECFQGLKKPLQFSSPLTVKLSPIALFFYPNHLFSPLSREASPTLPQAKTPKPPPHAWVSHTSLPSSYVTWVREKEHFGLELGWKEKGEVWKPTWKHWLPLPPFLPSSKLNVWKNRVTDGQERKRERERKDFLSFFAALSFPQSVNHMRFSLWRPQLFFRKRGNSWSEIKW